MSDSEKERFEILEREFEELYLKESIGSLINQTYQNWEMIFWDNVSTDNSKKILNEKTFRNYHFKLLCLQFMFSLY